nr:MAG TPA: hypothetical protein [Caudoviricetes sp.]
MILLTLLSEAVLVFTNLGKAISVPPIFVIVQSLCKRFTEIPQVRSSSALTSDE